MNQHEREVQALLDELVPQLSQLSSAAAMAEWNSACENTDEHEKTAEEAQNAFALFLANREAFTKLDAVRQYGDLSPELKRQVHTLYLMFFGTQFEEDEIRQLIASQSQVQSLFHRHRAVLNGKEVSDNELNDILATSTDTETVKAAWLASKAIGRVTAEPIRELAHMRNRLAQKRGFANYQEMSLALQEIDSTWLFQVLDDLKTRTDAPFQVVKKRLDGQLAKRFGISEAELMPWHYANPFFQEVPSTDDLDLTPYLQDQDVVDIAKRFYDSIGFDVNGILSRSDLYERQAKNQHAFCTDIDRAGDVRILCNVRPNRYWMNTMLHELGHAIYNAYIDRDLPYLLRSYPDIASTEAIALLLEDMPHDPTWLTAFAGIAHEEAQQMKDALRYQKALGKLVFVRWGLVMVYFERDLYSNPDQDLNALWWKYVTEFQGLRKPEGRDEPDYAAKYHIGCAPVYYHNYILGHLIADQLHESVLSDTASDTFANNRSAGEWLQNRYFGFGNRYPMPELVERATGKPLTATAFANAVTV